ncbi:MAG TPA: CRTAC1 family protein [Candidatus Saccharimonadales bacterium]|nr:CRTAC1 family protein [Candidatus Saccharimonadales bacterium]
MPDQVGSGVALFDFDRDGRLDVYLVQNGGTNHPAPNQLFHQEPDGTFKNVSAGSGLDIVGRGMGAFAGDLNNDGLPELLVTEYGAVHLFLNLGGGKFKEITREAGLENPRWAAPASFIDYDRDGWLDIVVGNYIDYDPTHVCLDVQGRQEFCAPKAFADTVTRLWHNKTKERGGLPEFEDRTEASGLTHAPGAALGLVCADFDGDGWPDIFCSDDTRANRLFVNRHNGTFTEQAAARGLAFNAMGATAANMGTAFGDVDGDGLPDLFITHLTEEFHGLWKQGPRGVFFDSVALAGLQRQSWRGTGFGTVLADFDCDGDADLVFLNGLVRRAAPGQTPVLAGVDSWWARYAQKAQIFSNNGKGEFSDSSSFNQSLCGQAIIGRSLAVGDLNNDGAMDLVLCSASGPVRVLQNTAPHRGHWLRLQLVDPAHGDRDEIGAEAVVEAAGRKWWALLQPATSYLASNDPVLHFGLADKSNLERITILWPDGVREVFPGGQADRLLTLHKGVGQKSPGATP